jgi:hypothetical protein
MHTQHTHTHHTRDSNLVLLPKRSVAIHIDLHQLLQGLRVVVECREERVCAEIRWKI